ncbi:sulfotransferase domain-containing protein [Alkalimarinus coralli]|uniref:sulfotransferase domain-containing protein n=1 Tax=Alkalimarinus coralli TaxID=2935863 RepID=UPI00202AC905|nr:sulfotransferase domain-containing protein [Alkalimarinus coralli]
MKAIHTWPKFARHIRRKEGARLLKNLGDFPDAVLVSGCQRSGTTVLSNLITASNGMVNFVTGRDSELDAALILSGYHSTTRAGRYCFQTTYLNESYPEYFSHNERFKLIWVVRNPHSVVCSILYNWRRFAFNELFEACGTQYLSPQELTTFNRFGHFTIPKVKRACLAYNGKVSQLFDIDKELNDRLLVIDYDNMIRDKKSALMRVYDFIGLDYKASYSNILSSKSMSKSDKLSRKQRDVIDQLCTPIYQRARSYAFNA